MRYKCTLFHEKWMSFEGEVARTKLYYLRGRKLPPYTIEISAYTNGGNPRGSKHPQFRHLSAIQHSKRAFSRSCYPRKREEGLNTNLPYSVLKRLGLRHHRMKLPRYSISMPPCLLSTVIQRLHWSHPRCLPPRPPTTERYMRPLPIALKGRSTSDANSMLQGVCLRHTAILPQFTLGSSHLYITDMHCGIQTL